MFQQVEELENQKKDLQLKVQRLQKDKGREEQKSKLWQIKTQDVLNKVRKENDQVAASSAVTALKNMQRTSMRTAKKKKKKNVAEVSLMSFHDWLEL